VNLFPLPAKCHEKGINARIADVLVWDGVKRLMGSPQLLHRQVQRYFDKKSQKVDHTADINEINHELDKLTTEEERYTKAYGQQVISLSQLTSFVQDIRLKRSVLEKKLDGLTVEQTQAPFAKPTDEQVKSYCQKTKAKLESLDFQGKRKVMLHVIDKIIANQKEVHVYGLLPMTEANYVKYTSESRYCRASERREIYIV